ncbi:cytochrome b [Paenalcaligenes sp. Me131]|uniref:cytochrome b n=1 Tax=Paenalcaligenes sp. Me131 TaxID=3392636 RepID=UPI003D2AAEAE
MQDNHERYGLVSRVLHWGMGAIFLWQFVGMGLLIILGETPLTYFFLGTHGPLGAVLFVLIMLRLGWLGRNARSRPQPADTCNGKLASLGHKLLYALMLIVPLLALLRSYGSGRAFAPFGISLWEASEPKISWMISVGNAAHGVLAWLLLALIVGHVGAAISHKAIKRDQVWSRMV